MKLAVFAYSRTGCGTARRVLAALPEADARCYTVARLQEPDFLPLEKQVYAAAFAGAGKKERRLYACECRADAAGRGVL